MTAFAGLGFYRGIAFYNREYSKMQKTKYNDLVIIY